MKSFIITSVAFGTLMFIGGAEANILPDTVLGFPNDAGKCDSWAGADTSRQELCMAFKACVRDSSDDKNDLENCFTDAQLAYKDTLRQPGGIVDVKEKESVSTDRGNSEYERIGDEKGWKNAHQGGE